MTTEQLKFFLTQARKNLSQAKKNASKHRPFNWRYPFKAELTLATKLNTQAKRVAVKVARLFNTYHATWKQDADDFLYKLLQLQGTIEEEFEEDNIFGIPYMSFVGKEIDQLDSLNQEELIRWMALYGLTLPVENLAWPQLKRYFAVEIRSRTQGIIADYFERLGILYNKFSEGKLTFDKFILTVNNTTKAFYSNKMDNLARDAIGGLNSKVQRYLFTTNGLDIYEWNTMGDERVRGNPAGLYPKAVPSHYRMQGLVVSWSRSEVYSTDGVNWRMKTALMEALQVGEAWGCRCTAVPYITHLLNQIDSI